MNHISFQLKISMNARQELTTVTKMHIAVMQMDHLIALASLAMKGMEELVKVRA